MDLVKLKPKKLNCFRSSKVKHESKNELKEITGFKFYV